MTIELYLRKFSSETTTTPNSKPIAKGPLYEIIKYSQDVSEVLIEPQSSISCLADALINNLKLLECTYRFQDPQANSLTQKVPTESDYETRKYLKWTRADKNQIRQAVANAPSLDDKARS